MDDRTERVLISIVSTTLASPSREDLQKVTDDHINLYTKAETPDALPILEAPFDISDEVPEDCEIADDCLLLFGLQNIEKVFILLSPALSSG